MRSKGVIWKNLCWVLVLLIGVAGIVYGCAPEFAREEWEIVLTNAINLCFQCIGLG